MKEVLELIEKRKQEFAQLSLFKFMQDKSIDPIQRLAWAPCLAPFSMGFGQLNRLDFRKEPTNDPIQLIINQHTYEDDHHWQWFLEDLEKLGLNHSMKFSAAVNFFWGEETEKTRQICHQIALHTFQAEPILVLAAIEAIEATAKVALSLTAQVAKELQEDTKQNYRYFGQHHFCLESSHTVGTDNSQQFVANLQLTEEQRAKAFELVEKVFEVFSESMEEIMAYAKKYPIKQGLTV
ncbi:MULTISPECIES: hypothetical protein [unclassified Nodularia (in: cyanobacteria)]|uniref:hypothetical protein n=1 Tax=unclassified Nodularia (in: cyanobacteria) TaxID=2656917 RepID=UPI0018816144|nr:MULTISPECIES: hypothetical protein [unclassified Nodularia (in: cyanobacteria)]MBE9198777.1 hypothetical protein [Nodularia sp. LEGE 06071]MCC2695135.1 hypothetical protein [Nodularia sp. LEGE 04288]